MEISKSKSWRIPANRVGYMTHPKLQRGQYGKLPIPCCSMSRPMDWSGQMLAMLRIRRECSKYARSTEPPSRRLPNRTRKVRKDYNEQRQQAFGRASFSGAGYPNRQRRLYLILALLIWSRRAVDCPMRCHHCAFRSSTHAVQCRHDVA